MIRWAYGVTCHSSRLNDLLPRTLQSLELAGFPKPHLFLDNVPDDAGWRAKGYTVTNHWPCIRVAGNWALSMAELYIRTPNAARYALFQDDLVTYRNLRRYLECSPYPEKSYLNLYTFPHNQDIAPKETGWFKSNQRGLGAVALVFTREAVVTLLQQPHFVERPQNVNRGHRAIDGGIVTAMNKAGWREYCHNPSLVQHTGKVSSMLNSSHPLAPSFRGEDFDALELLP